MNPSQSALESNQGGVVVAAAPVNGSPLNANDLLGRYVRRRCPWCYVTAITVLTSEFVVGDVGATEESHRFPFSRYRLSGLYGE